LTEQSQPYILISILVLAILIALVFVIWWRNRKESRMEIVPRTEIKSDWYRDIEKRVNKLKGTLDEKESRKLRLFLLLSLSQRVAEFSPGCSQCGQLQQDISATVKDLENQVLREDKQWRKSYNKSVNGILEHLQKRHKLVTENYYMGIGIAIGSGLGVALGSAFEYLGSGIPIGIGMGLAIGAALDAKAKKEGRVIITHDQAAGTSRTGMAIIFGIGIVVVLAIILLIVFRNYI